VPGETAATLGLTGEEVFTIEGVDEVLARDLADSRDVVVSFAASAGAPKKLTATLRIDTPQEVRYYRHGGILPYVVRQMV
jgi:aconitate hydratase